MVFDRLDECLMCDSKGTVEILENDTWDFGGGPDCPPYLVSEIVCYHCTNCDEKFVTGVMDKVNRPKIIEAKRRAKNLLSGEEIGRIPAQVGLSAKELEQVLGLAPNVFSKWKNSQIIQSASSDALLLAIRENPDFIHTLTSRRGLQVTGRQKGRPPKAQLKQRKAY